MSNAKPLNFSVTPFGESGFAHGDLLRGHSQYVGRSLNVNGPLYRNAYITSSNVTFSRSIST
jgi:hypothetical protein